MRLGLRGRILLLVLVALAPPTAIALLVAFEERREARARAQSDLLDTGRFVSADVARLIDGTASFLRGVSGNLAKDPGRRHCESLLALVPRSTNQYSSVGVAKPSGRVYCGATAKGLARHAADVSRAGWFQAARGRRDFVLGDFGKDPLTAMDSLVAAYPLPGPHTAAGPNVMFAALDIRRLGRATAL